jgi:aryl-alcohol dehydrogenase-like predicted oxidoreductase
VARLELRPFGRTALQVSPLALSAFATRAYGPRGLRLRPEDIETAFHEHGVTTFGVHRWMPDVVEGVRRLIRGGYRDRLVLISEVWAPLRGSVRRGWEQNARALGVDTLDVFLLAWAQTRWYLQHGAWDAMRRLKRDGKVRAIGFSSHDRRLAAVLAGEPDVDALMIRYNAAHRGAERAVFAAPGANRPAIIAYTATRWGLLLKPLPERGFPRAMTAGECYRFVLAQPAVDLVLCAPRTATEIAEDVAAVLEGPLDPGRLDECRRFGDAVHAAARGGWRWMFHEPKVPGPSPGSVGSATEAEAAGYPRQRTHQRE